MFGSRSVDNVNRIVTDRAALSASVCVARNTGPIRVDGIARVVRPDRIVDTYWVLCVPSRIEPL